MNKEISAYNQSLPEEFQKAAGLLAREISKHLKEAENKIWHAHPVWFLEGNPIVGYSLRKKGLCLMFWSGQTFEEENLKPEGKFKAAEIFYHEAKEINKADLQRWLEKAREIQWDYKNIIKRRGRLVRV